MAKKKKTARQQPKQKAFSSEEYLQSRMRKNQIWKCYLNPNWKEMGMATIIVIRKHPQGTYSSGVFLVDTWCRGLADAYYLVNMDQEELDHQISHYMKEYPEKIDEADYDLVHNIIYGAIEFAGEAGLLPCKEWKYIQYMLEEDNDDVPYIELEFGKDGKYFVNMVDQIKSKQIRAILDKTVGEENYDYLEPVDEEEDWYEDEEEENNYGERSGFPLNQGESGVYTYKRPKYPELSALENLNYPWVLEAIQAPLNKLRPKEMEKILALPHEKLAADLDLIIRVIIGHDGGLIEQDNYDDIKYSYDTLATAMEILGEVGDEKNLDTVFEILRQSDVFIDYYFGDILEDYLPPVIYKLCKNNTEALYQFMIEPGLYWFHRNMALNGFVNMIMLHEPKRREEAIGLVRRLFEYYLANADNPEIWDGGLVGLMLGEVEILRAKELIPLVRDLYATGKVDENCYGVIEEAVESLSNSDKEPDDVPLDIIKWHEYMLKLLKRFDA